MNCISRIVSILSARLERTLKIVQVITDFTTPPLGGMESVVYNLARELSERGHDIVIITSSKNVRKVKRKSFDKLQILYLPSFHFHSEVVIPRCLAEAREAIRDSDVIHVLASHEGFSLILGLIGKLEGKPLVTSVLGYFDLLRHINPLNRFLGMFVETSATVLIKVSDAVHVKNVADYMKLSRMGKRLFYVPDGIPKKYFVSPRNPNLMLRKLGLKAQTKVILYVGRLHPLKGPHILIRAMRKVLEENSNVVSVIIGPDRGYGRKLRKLIKKFGLKEHVFLTGSVSEKIKLSAYDAAQMVVIPSICDSVEAYSIVASEAWARGRILVASAVGALKYRVRNGVNGYLAKPGNEKNLAENILKALENPKIKSIPKDVWTWNQVADLMESLYKEVVGHCGST